MNDIVKSEGARPADPFGPMRLAGGGGMNVGAVAIEQERAIAEARGQMQLAKMFPRSVQAAIAEFLEACKSSDFAKGAFYSVPNRGSGPSIRFAEEAARCYGNFEYGHRELSRSDGKSEIEVYAWDKEKNNRSPRQITVLHVQDTREGPKVLRDQADIDNKIANVASKQIRGRILALLPKHMILAGQAECKKTLAGNNDKPLAERVQGAVGAFAKYGVTIPRLERHLGHKIDETNVDELADLIGIFNALKEGAKVADYFPNEEAPEAAAQAITEAAKAASAKTAEKAEPPAGKKAEPEAPKETKPAGRAAAKKEPAQAPAPAPAPEPTSEEQGAGEEGAATEDDDVF